jgi:hypothetical protein
MISYEPLLLSRDFVSDMESVKTATDRGW